MNSKDCIHRKLIRVKPISTLQVIYNNEKKIYSDTRFAYTDLTL